MKKILLLMMMCYSAFTFAQITATPYSCLQGQTLDVRLSGNFSFGTVSTTGSVSFFNALAGFLDVNDVFPDPVTNEVIANITAGPNAIDGWYSITVQPFFGSSITEQDGFYVGASSSGNPFNSISGTVRMDYDGNGCDAADATYPNLRINATYGTTTRSCFTRSDGTYTLYGLPQTTVTVTPALENPTFYIASPASPTFTFPSGSGGAETQDFCISANGNQSNAQVTIIPLGGARPGFNASYRIYYRNTGNQILDGSITLFFNNTITDTFVSTPAADSVTGGNAVWSFNDLLPFAGSYIDITVRVHTPTETNPANAGDFLSFGATMAYTSPDATSFTTTGVYTQTIVNSFDPNDKICLEGDAVTTDMIGEYLRYVIDFENTGSADAINISVVDVIDPDSFDISTLQVLESSSDVTARINGDAVQFTFTNINLAPDAIGHVTFKVKTRNTLTNGSSVSNKANIFFDFNFPIETNTATTTFQTLATKSFVTADDLTVYPNPANKVLNISTQSNISNVQLFDIRGRKLLDVPGNDRKIDVSQLNKGVYLLKIATSGGELVRRIIKE